MQMKRRDMLGVAAFLGLGSVVGEARAGLWDFLMNIWHNDMSQAERDAVTGWITQEAASLLRKAVVAYLFASEEHAGHHVGGGGMARINIRITKHSSGHLVLASHLQNIDGGSQPHLTLSGTAPHHRHPSVRTHIHEIMTRSHVYLRSRNL
jgi:hypothetical protein